MARRRWRWRRARTRVLPVEGGCHCYREPRAWRRDVPPAIATAIHHRITLPSRRCSSSPEEVRYLKRLKKVAVVSPVSPLTWYLEGFKRPELLPSRRWPGISGRIKCPERVRRRSWQHVSRLINAECGRIVSGAEVLRSSGDGSGHLRRQRRSPVPLRRELRRVQERSVPGAGIRRLPPAAIPDSAARLGLGPGPILGRPGRSQENVRLGHAIARPTDA